MKLVETRFNFVNLKNMKSFRIRSKSRNKTEVPPEGAVGVFHLLVTLLCRAVPAGRPCPKTTVPCAFACPCTETVKVHNPITPPPTRLWLRRMRLVENYQLVQIRCVTPSRPFADHHYHRHGLYERSRCTKG